MTAKRRLEAGEVLWRGFALSGSRDQPLDKAPAFQHVRGWAGRRMMLSGQEGEGASEDIFDSVRENSRAQAFAPVGQQPQDPPLQHDDQHDPAVVAVAQTEEHGLGEGGERAAAGPRKELADQIATEEQLFAEGTAERQD